MATTTPSKRKTRKVTKKRTPMQRKRVSPRPVARKRVAPRRGQAGFKRLDTLTDVINKIEIEAEKIAKRLIERAEEASADLRTSIEELVSKIRTNGLYSIAADKKDDLEREIRRLAEEVVDRAKDVELLPFNAAHRDRLINEAKRNLEELRDRLHATEWLEKARVSASQTKEQVLNILSIPSQKELTKLQRKITTLEKRVNKLKKKAA